LHHPYPINKRTESADIPAGPPQSHGHQKRDRPDDVETIHLGSSVSSCSSSSLTRYHQRVIRSVFFIVALAASTPAPAAAPTTVEIVLDASGGMHQGGVGGTPIHASVREALVAVIAEAAALRPEMTIGLRLAGGRAPGNEAGPCSATSAPLPATDVDPGQWARILDAVEPHGLRPLIGSVLATLGDLETESKDPRVVVVTSGDDQCGAGPYQVAAALAVAERPIELRMVGLGLDQSVLDRFGAVPTRNATTAEELLSALRWAVLEIEDEPRTVGALLLEPAADIIDPGVTRVQLDDLATGATHTETINGQSRFELPTGRYRLAVEPEEGGRFELRDILIVAGGDTEVELDLRPPPPVVLDLGTDPAIVGTQIWIDIAGDAPALARLVFVDANGLAVSPLEDPIKNHGWINAPPLTGTLDLLLVNPAAGGVHRVLARRPITLVAGVPNLTASDDVEAGENLTVNWSGSPAFGDFVALVPREGSAADVLSCTAVSVLSELRLRAPSMDAELDLIYVVGKTLAVSARYPLKVTAPAVSLAAPDRIAAGERFEITWSGPEGDEDFLSLALPEYLDDAYLEWGRIEDGKVLTFRAPDKPGVYEVRYVDGDTGKALARTRIEVMSIPIELRVPSTSAAGLRFEVQWTGPAAPGDFISISKPGSHPHQHLDWASTTFSSPLTLAAPPKPGTYEVRYVTGSGREILAFTTIEVRP